MTNLDLSGTKESNGKIVPNMNLENFQLILHDDDIRIDVYDSIVAWAADLFIFFFKGWVLPGIVHKLQESVPASFNAEVNQFMLETKGLLDTGVMGAGLDFSYSAPPQISKDHLQLFFNGTIFDYSQPEYVPSEGSAVMDVDKTTTESIQMGLSAQMVDSGLYVLHKKSYFIGVITPAIAAAHNITLDTTFMEDFFPGLVKRYGEHELMNITLATWGAPLAIS